MKKRLTLWALALLITAGVASADPAATLGATFSELMKPYEQIRRGLLHDTVDGVAENASVIREQAGAATVGVPPEGDERDEEIEQLLAEISASAGRLAEAPELEAAREAFYELSKTMVRYRSKVGGDELPVVAYCPMANKSWLQPEGEIGNPYYGQSMAACGVIVTPESAG